MKTSELTTGSVYAYEEHRTWGDAKPVLVLDTKLWTIAEVWLKKYEVMEAPKGVRGRAHSWNRPAIGIPVIILEQGHWWWGADQDSQILDTAQELLALAAQEIDFESFKGQHDNNPVSRMRTTVEARLVNGGTIKVTAKVVFLLPQTIASLWTPYLLKIEAGKVASIDLATKAAAEEAAKLGETAAIMRRLNDLVGANPSPYASDGNDIRRDIWRHKDYTGDFSISKELLLALLDRAENSQA
jgi:hypothetical protein